MKLNQDVLAKEAVALQGMGYTIPCYDRQAMIVHTLNNPAWIHFGAGNIFRAFVAAEYDALVAKGAPGIVVAETFDGDIIHKAYTPYDDLSINVQLRADGTIQKQIVGSVAQAISADEDAVGELESMFVKPSLQIVSFTITEKGYALLAPAGGLLPAVQHDYEVGPSGSKSLFGHIARLLYCRFMAGCPPIALLSLDNCSHNGSKLCEAVCSYAEAWCRLGYVPDGFICWLRNDIAWPWSMIDKITPGPDGQVYQRLQEDGWEHIEPLTTEKGAKTAAFVNAEQTGYLVVEDSFPNGRPPLEDMGVLLTTRETVDKAERMKVCTCLNPLHTALAILGCLLGYTSIHEEMQEEGLVALVERLGYVEGLPVVENPEIVNPREFLCTVLEQRLRNPFIPDTPQRIACDTSQKLPIRFGNTIKSYVDKGLDINKLVAIPLILAAWCRYLWGIDDQGAPMQLSPDPLLQKLSALFMDKHFGENKLVPTEILGDSSLFGIDLFSAGLADRVQEYYSMMCLGSGAVRQTINRIISL